jgi:hypothetical protein
MRKNILWMLLGSIITILFISCFTFFTSYEKNMHQMLGTSVKYKHESITTHLSSDVCGYLTTGKKRSLYFGELPSQESAIEINSPDRATLYVYPLDDDSIIIRYEPRNGIKRTYKKSGFGDFNRVLKTLYELTDNEIFNETIDYDN